RVPRCTRADRHGTVPARRCAPRLRGPSAGSQPTRVPRAGRLCGRHDRARRAAGAGGLSHTARNGSVGHTRGTVLVVDDEPTIGDVVSRYLERAGYRTAVAATGDDAL